ncbi:uncharacterized protein LOC141639822 [Silene latifolia]|uniref:uncharacterized protein LOC141639822 n=1 Tax=Silene latifolia TaxID=37657 RepID=UPI003D76CD4C
MGGERQASETDTKYKKKIGGLSQQCQGKTDDCYQAWMSLTIVKKQLEVVRTELDRKSNLITKRNLISPDRVKYGLINLQFVEGNPFLPLKKDVMLRISLAFAELSEFLLQDLARPNWKGSKMAFSINILYMENLLVLKGEDIGLQIRFHC